MRRTRENYCIAEGYTCRAGLWCKDQITMIVLRSSREREILGAKSQDCFDKQGVSHTMHTCLSRGTGRHTYQSASGIPFPSDAKFMLIRI